MTKKQKKNTQVKHKNKIANKRQRDNISVRKAYFLRNKSDFTP